DRVWRRRDLDPGAPHEDDVAMLGDAEQADPERPGVVRLTVTPPGSPDQDGRRDVPVMTVHRHLSADPAGLGEPVDRLPERDRVRRLQADAAQAPLRAALTRAILPEPVLLDDPLAAPLRDRPEDLRDRPVAEV